MADFGILDEREYVRIIRIYHDEDELRCEVETGNGWKFSVLAVRVVPLNNEE